MLALSTYKSVRCNFSTSVCDVKTRRDGEQKEGEGQSKQAGARPLLLLETT